MVPESRSGVQAKHHHHHHYYQTTYYHTQRHTPHTIANTTRTTLLPHPIAHHTTTTHTITHHTHTIPLLHTPPLPHTTHTTATHNTSLPHTIAHHTPPDVPSSPRGSFIERGLRQAHKCHPHGCFLFRELPASYTHVPLTFCWRRFSYQLIMHVFVALAARIYSNARECMYWEDTGTLFILPGEC